MPKTGGKMDILFNLEHEDGEIYKQNYYFIYLNHLKLKNQKEIWTYYNENENQSWGKNTRKFRCMHHCFLINKWKWKRKQNSNVWPTLSCQWVQHLWYYHDWNIILIWIGKNALLQFKSRLQILSINIHLQSYYQVFYRDKYDLLMSPKARV